jgi:Ca2+-binding EF-hand superfamily protein
MQGLGNGRADLNGDGQISLKELVDFVGPRVTREAAKANRAQHPALKAGEKMSSTSGQLMLVWGLEPT